MTNLTDHLTKLTCAAKTARDYGYVHTSRTLEKMVEDERLRLARLRVHKPTESSLSIAEQ